MVPGGGAKRFDHRAAHDSAPCRRRGGLVEAAPGEELLPARLGLGAPELRPLRCWYGRCRAGALPQCFDLSDGQTWRRPTCGHDGTGTPTSFPGMTRVLAEGLGGRAARVPARVDPEEVRAAARTEPASAGGGEPARRDAGGSVRTRAARGSRARRGRPSSIPQRASRGRGRSGRGTRDQVGQWYERVKLTTTAKVRYSSQAAVSRRNSPMTRSAAGTPTDIRNLAR